MKGLLSAAAIGGLLSVAGCGPLPPTQDDVEAQALQLKQATDELIQSAVQSGQAVVVTTTINLDADPMGDFNDPDVAAEFQRIRWSATQWTNINDPEAHLTVGNSRRAFDIGPTGNFYQTVFGRVLYQVYIVSPGTYRLSGANYQLPRTEIPNPQLSLPKPIKPSALGQVVLTKTNFAEFNKAVEWRDASYGTRTESWTGCTAVHVMSGACVSSQKFKQEVTELRDPAGYRSVTQKKDVAGAMVTVSLKKDFARFTIKPGEVLLVDGFYADPPISNYSADSCKQVAANDVRCELDRVTFTRMSTSLEDWRNASDPAKYGYTGMSAVLKAMRYQEPEILAKPVKQPSRWGIPYQLK